ncbi:hypothetical protein MSBRW_3564 [Methanosarcina barkeri str. Wiesmoor]|uniref:DUF1673 domain-containing protein n=2 Tax=Methanosarcina barkeri TaxID=2208 RepID=A0A0E3QR79_METBA|nr:DUF1673 family protein [Methanosarcina barkeri]AKB52817.1 hypothetical protein MSBRW_3564 [Methanosarcina barkeri str. Wiesmoor]
MSAKVFVFDQIKKLMGWCPNAKPLETGSRSSPVNFEAYARSRGEKARSPLALNRFSRLDVRLLLPTLFLTPLYTVMLLVKGVNFEFLFLGILFSLMINLLFWKNQIREYDAAAKKPTVRYISKIVLFFVFFSLILFLSFPPIVFLSYTPSSISSQSMYSFIAATWILTMWGTCLQLFYWEKKNHMIIHIKNENRFQKTYTIGEKEGGK